MCSLWSFVFSVSASVSEKLIGRFGNQVSGVNFSTRRIESIRTNRMRNGIKKKCRQTDRTNERTDGRTKHKIYLPCNYRGTSTTYSIHLHFSKSTFARKKLIAYAIAFGVLSIVYDMRLTETDRVAEWTTDWLIVERHFPLMTEFECEVKSNTIHRNAAPKRIHFFGAAKNLLISSHILPLTLPPSPPPPTVMFIFFLLSPFLLLCEMETTCTMSLLGRIRHRHVPFSVISHLMSISTFAVYGTPPL